MPSSRGSSQPSSLALQAESLLSEPPGKPKNTGVGRRFLLQGNSPTQELNQGLLHYMRILYQPKPPGKPKSSLMAMLSLKCLLDIGVEMAG